MPLPAQCCRSEQADDKTACSPDLSLRGGAADVAISGRQLRFRRECLVIRPYSARFPRRVAPRNDKLGSLAPMNLCRDHCRPAWRSGSAATDTIGTHHFNGGLYELQMPSRDCHVGLRPPRNDKSEGHCGRRCYSATCQPARRSLSAATFFSRAAALCSERRCRPRRDRFPLYRRPVRVGSIAPGPAVRSPAMITPSGPPA